MSRGARFVAGEALLTFRARPQTFALIVCTIAVALGTISVVYGISFSGARQTEAVFDHLRPTTLLVEQNPLYEPWVGTIHSPTLRSSVLGISDAAPPVSYEALNAVASVPGIKSVTVLSRIVDRVSTPRPMVPVERNAPVELIAVAVAGQDPLAPQIRTGHSLSLSAESARWPIALVGAEAADILGIRWIAGLEPIFIDRPFTVVGIADFVGSYSSLRRSVLVPAAFAEWAGWQRGEQSMLVEVLPGSAEVVAERLPAMLRPTAPESLRVLSGLSLGSLRADISEQLDGLVVGVTAATLVLATLSVAMTSHLSVKHRTPEIGMRRALGATRREVANLFLAESVITTFLGGILGGFLGATGLVVVANLRGWIPILPLYAVWGAPLIGGLVGALASAAPAVAAARLTPDQSMRG